MKKFWETENRFFIFDGGMGTELQKRGYGDIDNPSLLNLTHGELIKEIHREYQRSGADIISSNTFNASPFKLKGEENLYKKIIKKGVQLAKESNPYKAALDIGPLGDLLEPNGTLSFEKAYSIFKEMVIAGKNAGADLILFETFSDLYELKAGILAAKEYSDLPIFATITIEKDGRTFLGLDSRTAILSLQQLGADVVGLNCSLGPREMKPWIDKTKDIAYKPLMIQANAGLPNITEHGSRYPLNAEDFASAMLEFHDDGVQFIGGCCGTEPSYIKKLSDLFKSEKYAGPQGSFKPFVSSYNHSVEFDKKFTVVGERINPAGKEHLMVSLRENSFEAVIEEAISQKNHKADILDVHLSAPGLDEEFLLSTGIKEIQRHISTPLQIDTMNARALESALRVYNGVPLVNSVNGKMEWMDTVFPLVKKYGGMVVALTLDKKGIPSDAEGRIEIAKKIIIYAEKWKIPKEQLIFDALVLTIGHDPESPAVTLETLRRLKGELNVKTILGVSNISHGLPMREEINRFFLGKALDRGLDIGIINPLDPGMHQTLTLHRLVSGKDEGARSFIKEANLLMENTLHPVFIKENFHGKEELLDWNALIFQGRKDSFLHKLRAILESESEFNYNELIENQWIPALLNLGDAYEKGEIYLPQLLQSSEIVKMGMGVIYAALKNPLMEKEENKKILLATVEGDLHDIGKNIVKLMSESYGIKVIDLGKDVSPDRIITGIEKENIRIVGLSGLMTTSIPTMKVAIRRIKERDPSVKIIVGGAVLTKELALEIGADGYGKDASQGVQWILAEIRKRSGENNQ